ncbi:MAG: SEC-C domain-containing protein [Microthrixaceae bacterium]|nr:SEC-C domain-containing protein [Microthrixaceae bacterium]
MDLFDEAGEWIGVVESDGWLIDGVDTDVVLGPEGWLEDFAGSWIAFRVNQGALAIEHLAGPPSVDPARADAVAAAFEAVAEHQRFQAYGADEPVDVWRSELSTVLQEAILREGPLFAGEPVSASGTSWMRPGSDSSSRGSCPPTSIQRSSPQRSPNAGPWHDGGVDADAVLGARMLLGAMSLHADGDPDAFGATTDEREMAPALFAGLLQREPITRIVGYECADGNACDRALGFAQAIAAAFGDDPHIWGPDWLAAHCHLVLGDVDAAAELLDGMPSEITCLPVLVDRAMVAADRSRALEAHRLLSEAERQVEDLSEFSLLSYRYRQLVSDLFDEVDVWATNTPPAAARRNDRCPCGSGRKYKVCHLGRELHPIEERSAWLYQKMTRFARTGERDEIHTLAPVMVDAMGSPQSWDSLVDAPFIVDIVLHEGGAGAAIPRRPTGHTP